MLFRSRARYRFIRYDLEGHGRSPTRASSIVTLSSYEDDLEAIFQDRLANLSGGATIIAHGMGALFASSFASHHPHLVKGLVLVGPPPPFSRKGANDQLQCNAEAVRMGGMTAVALTRAIQETAPNSRSKNPQAFSAVYQSLMNQEDRKSTRLNSSHWE